MGIELHHATPAAIPEIVNFVMKARKDMFPMLDAASHARTAEREFADFEQTYLGHHDGSFFTARADGVIVATIAYVAYDRRFPELQFRNERVVEVVRLYVDPAFRRTGLASKMFDTLRWTACEAGIHRFYLHTHPFLPGAIAFWERHGFSILQIDDDPVWQTTHMSRLLDG